MTERWSWLPFLPKSDCDFVEFAVFENGSKAGWARDPTVKRVGGNGVWSIGRFSPCVLV